MGKHLGIDIGDSAVRVVLVRTAYRRVIVEALAEEPIESGASVVDAIRAAAGPLFAQGEGVAVTLPGDRAFVRTIELPKTALRQLAEVLPFELEAQLPIDLADLVYDSALFARADADAPLRVRAVAARIDDVRARIELVREAIGLEPERVVPAGTAFAPLAALVASPEIAGPLLFADVDARHAEVVVVEGGVVVFERTLSRGTAGLPESAPVLARELRQTLAAFRVAGGAPVARIFLSGAGAEATGAEAYLSAELEIPVSVLPAPAVELGPNVPAVPARFAKALGLALGLDARPKGLDLRRGPLAYERGFGFLREKVPLLVGLGAAIVVSFFFKTWAEVRGLDRDREALETGLAALSREVLGEETRDPARVLELIDKGCGGADEDPLPRVDAVDVMAQLAQAVPPSLPHDVEELDVQRGHVVIHGVVPSVNDAQQIAGALKVVKCFQDVRVTKTSQAVGDERQKYVIELEAKCEAEKSKKPADSGSPASSAAPSGAEGAKP